MNTFLKKITLFAFSLMFAFGGTFAPLNIAQAAGSAPVIGVTTPTNGDIIYKSDGAYTISAAVTDSDDDIASVKWELTGAYSTNSDKEAGQDSFENNGSGTWEGTYALNHPNFPTGSYTLVFTATDGQGNKTPKTISNLTLKDEPEAAAPEITNVDAYYSTGTGYTAIGVDFTTENFTNATDVELRVNRTDSSTYSITAQQSVINAINTTSPKTTSGPIVITGTRTSGSWNNQTGTWSGSALPVSVDVIITLDGDTTVTLRDTTISENLASQSEVLPAPSDDRPRTNIEVTGNTVTLENPTGWWFNRDTSTSSPYEFTNDEKSIGDGSLFVKPIGVNPSDKFIGELFEKTEINRLNSFSYDVMMAAGNENKINVSVYANIDDSDNYYDCRYDYVPSGTNTSSFTTVTFDKNDTPVNVAKSSTSRVTEACPATLAGMPSGSFARVFAINVGDTSASDTGLSAYLDKVVLDTDDEVTTYDFEKAFVDTTPPSITISAPTEGGQVLGVSTLNITGTITDPNFKYYYCYLTTNQAITYNGNPYTPGQEVGVRDANCVTTWTSVETDGPIGGIDMTGLPVGSYTINVVAYDTEGNNNAAEPVSVTFDYDATTPEEGPETPPASDSNPPTNSSSGSRVIGGRSFTAAPAAQPGRVLGAEAYNFTLLLKRGSRGPEVMELQKYLNEHGYNSGAVDGIFGPVTEGAVKLFQIANGLVPDGIVGPLTRAVLNAQA